MSYKTKNQTKKSENSPKKNYTKKCFSWEHGNNRDGNTRRNPSRSWSFISPHFLSSMHAGIHWLLFVNRRIIFGNVTRQKYARLSCTIPYIHTVENACKYVCECMQKMPTPVLFMQRQPDQIFFVFLRTCKSGQLYTRLGTKFLRTRDTIVFAHACPS